MPSEPSAISDKAGFVTSMSELASVVKLHADEDAWFPASGSPPLLISRYMLSLIDQDDPEDPIRRQVIPTMYELNDVPEISQDPLEETNHTVCSRLIHRYANRVAFLSTDVCATYCRHCFRRRFSGTNTGPASREEVLEVARYVKSHPQIREMLVTGGDPLTISDQALLAMLETIRQHRPDLVLRICTRVPVTYPHRVNDHLVSLLAGLDSAALYLMVQFNHPRELTHESIEAVGRFVDAGIPAFNQTVLLKDVNDNPDVLELLMNKLIANRIKPYYLFQGDLVRGTSHFRVPLEHGMAIEAELRNRLSGLAMPVYAIDLPGGGGKVPLGRRYLEGKDSQGSWVFQTIDGQKRVYPDPET